MMLNEHVIHLIMLYFYNIREVVRYFVHVCIIHFELLCYNGRLEHIFQATQKSRRGEGSART